MKICFATNNGHKISEISQLIGSKISLESLKDIGCNEELPETTGTIEGNSKQKAEYVFKKYGVPCFADDTGLEVVSLNGRPGVDSAHYAGAQRSSEDNMALLLSNLSNFVDKSSQFKTVITFVDSTGVYQFTGMVSGEITGNARGTNGFGYDPIFVPQGQQLTFAEMTSDQKSKISHRARATSQLIEWLQLHFKL
jgi:XTP/dITP diphosphohydrolase